MPLVPPVTSTCEPVSNETPGHICSLMACAYSGRGQKKTGARISPGARLRSGAVSNGARYGSLHASFFSAVLVQVPNTASKHKLWDGISSVTRMSSVAGRICGPGRFAFFTPTFHL